MKLKILTMTTALVAFTCFPKASMDAVALSNSGHTILSAMNESQQVVFLAKSAASAGNTVCSTASASRPFFQGFDSEQSAYWNITCVTEAFTVMIENNAEGSTSTMPCSLLRSIGIECYTKLD